MIDGSKKDNAVHTIFQRIICSTILLIDSRTKQLCLLQNFTFNCAKIVCKIQQLSNDTHTFSLSVCIRLCRIKCPPPLKSRNCHFTFFPSKITVPVIFHISVCIKCTHLMVLKFVHGLHSLDKLYFPKRLALQFQQLLNNLFSGFF